MWSIQQQIIIVKSRSKDSSKTIVTIMYWMSLQNNLKYLTKYKSMIL